MLRFETSDPDLYRAIRTAFDAVVSDRVVLLKGIDRIIESSLTLAHVAQLLASNVTMDKLRTIPGGDILRQILMLELMRNRVPLDYRRISIGFEKASSGMRAKGLLQKESLS